MAMAMKTYRQLKHLHFSCYIAFFLHVVFVSDLLADCIYVKERSNFTITILSRPVFWCGCKTRGGCQLHSYAFTHNCWYNGVMIKMKSC